MSFNAELDAVLALTPLQDLVQMYFDHEDRGFAGRLFNTIGNNDRTQITAEDIVAVSLLDVPFSAAAVRRLLDSSAEQASVSSLLADIPEELPIWNATSELEQGSASWRLWDLLNAYPHVGPARISKLMARKRPHLIPIQDSVLHRVVPSGGFNYWDAFRNALAYQARMGAVEELRGEIPLSIPTLRLLDVAIWMVGSQSENAQAAREECGLLRSGYDAQSLAADGP